MSDTVCRKLGYKARLEHGALPHWFIAASFVNTLLPRGYFCYIYRLESFWGYDSVP